LRGRQMNVGLGNVALEAERDQRQINDCKSYRPEWGSCGPQRCWASWPHSRSRSNADGEL
jgi:hypothetical protein